ncbi:MAG: hypothetical protein QXT73_06470, partial [Candidatus Methanomethylicaceae archaeon]
MKDIKTIEDIEERVKLARREDLSREDWQILVKDRSKKVKLTLAQNPTCPEWLLEHLSRDEDSNVRSNVARHPQCPPAVLEHLSRNEERDEDWQVRKQVASHP